MLSVSPSVCLSVCLRGSVYYIVCQSVCLSICLSPWQSNYVICQSVCLSPWQRILCYLSVRLSVFVAAYTILYVSPSVCLYVCLRGGVTMLSVSPSVCHRGNEYYAICQSVCLSICLSSWQRILYCMSVRLSVYMSVSVAE